MIDRLYKKGFTLVELLCAIVILGLLVTMASISIYNVVENSKEESILKQEKLLKKATESYIQDNSSKAPKAIGDSVNISLKELKSKKYITEDIINSKKETCMDNSYIRVYKLSKAEYTYLSYLYCGGEKVPDIEEIPEPNVKVLFIDGNNENNNNLIFNNKDESRLYLEINGGTTPSGDLIEINNYSMVISMRTTDNSDLVEYYSSGLIDVNRKTNFTLDKKISNYVNFSNATSINVTVTAHNIIGGVKSVTVVAQSNINNGN